jgi:transposase
MAVLLTQQYFSCSIMRACIREDARKLPPSVQEEKRKLAIKLWKTGMMQKDITVIIGVSPQSVSAWIKRYEMTGVSSLKARRRAP